MIAMGVIAVLIAIGGHNLLVGLGGNKLWGGLFGVALIVLAVRELRGAYDPSRPDARAEVTKSGAYLIAAVLVLWAILFPARWVFGSCIVAAEVALVFDIITLAARSRATGGT